MVPLRRRIATSRPQKEAIDNDPAEGLISVLEPNSPAAEAYRSLRTNLLHGFVDAPPKVVVLTSPNAGEGKSITCANLGVSLAQAGKNTLVVDCDLRKPDLHRYFGLRNTWGIVDLLAGELSLQEVWNEPVENLKVITGGSIPASPAETIDSRRFAELLAGVRENFDYVLLDAPPVGRVSDPTILATQGDGVLLILNAQKTRKVSVRQSVRSLEAVGANVLGTVVNCVKGDEDGYYYSYGYNQK